MPDPYGRVNQGDPVTFSATAWNAMLDAGKDFRARQQSGNANDRTTTRRSDLIAVRNDTGGNLDRFSVVGLGGPVFPPADSLTGFQQEVVLKGVAPTALHLGRFAILNEPVPDGFVARGWVAGVRQVQIDVLADADRYADVNPDGSTDMLLSGPTGSVVIIWKEGDDDVAYATGPQWAVVRFGSTATGMVYAKIQSGDTVTAASGATLGSGQVTICSISGYGLTDDGEVVGVKNAGGVLSGPKFVVIGYVDDGWSLIVGPCP